MRHAVVIDAVRTPIGRATADKGYYRNVRSEDLSAHVIRAIVERTGIDPHLIEDVRWGCVQQQGEQGFDVARIAAQHFVERRDRLIEVVLLETNATEIVESFYVVRCERDRLA